MWKRIWVLFHIRNKEYYRDKAAFGWNFLFPFLIIFGFSFIFNQDNNQLYKAGIITSEISIPAEYQKQYRNFIQVKYIEFVKFQSKENALNQLKRHRIDILISPRDGRYWINESSPSGYILENLLHSDMNHLFYNIKKQVVNGKETSYINWLFPGILGMSMMFSSLFGVGVSVVRYRKNSMLKRLSLTPTKTYEFLIAQVLSRIFLLLVSTGIVYLGCKLIFDFKCVGSYFNLILVYALGGFSMVSLGLLIASRTSSEEFAAGFLNFIAWPMMFLSEVWFSMEGANPWVQKLSQFLPLSHLTESARRVMNDGANLIDMMSSLVILVMMSICFLSIGSMLFKWND